jgi:hypothetical protein
VRSSTLRVVGLLARIPYVSGMSCNWPSRHRVSWFSSVLKQVLRWFPSLSCCCVRPPPLKFVKSSNPLAMEGNKLSFQIMQFTVNYKIKIPQPLFRTAVYNIHPPLQSCSHFSDDFPFSLVLLSLFPTLSLFQ